MIADVHAPTTGDNRLRRDDAWFVAAVGDALPFLYAGARRLTRDAVNAEDLVAEAIAAAWEKRDSLRDRAAFRGWIIRILTNAYLAQLRAARSRPAEDSFEDLAEHQTFSLFERLHQPFLLWWGNPERAFLERLVREDFERALDALPEGMRTAVVLADVQGMSYAAIAELLEIPVGTVRSRLARGRSLLQQALWEHAVDAGIVSRNDKSTQGESA